MNNNEDSKYLNKVITIPNILSFFRLCLIPVLVWLYCFKQDPVRTVIVLVLSGLTDVADGIIARKFNMISNFGKAFDPVADKLTQIAMLFCLVTRFPHMLVPLILLVIKEISAGIMGLMVIKKTGKVLGAVWHGKATTFCLYTTMGIHLIWFSIPPIVSDILICVCTALILLSAVLYCIRNVRAIRDHKKNSAQN